MNKKSSILIIILFLLFVSSLLVLIIFNYFTNVLNSFSELKRYYKAYWLANAGIEIQKYKIFENIYGFEDTISSGSDTNKKNFSCKNCFFESKLYSKSKIFGIDENIYFKLDCDEVKYIILNGGEAIVLPLFGVETDLNVENTSNITSLVSYNNQIEIYNTGFSNTKFIIGFIDKNLNRVVSEKNINNVSYTIAIPGSLDNEKYLAIVNKSDKKQSFCVKFRDKIPILVYQINSYGIYNQRYVGLSYTYYQKIPEFFIYNIISN